MVLELSKFTKTNHGLSDATSRKRISRILVLFGLALSFTVGSVMLYIALQHNPHNSIYNDVIYMVSIWLSWAAISFSPFLLLAIIHRFIFGRKKKVHK